VLAKGNIMKAGAAPEAEPQQQQLAEQ